MLRIPYLIIVIFLLLTFHQTKGQESAFELKTVVIDPGHGGKDPGAVIGSVKEKDIVLDVALRTGKLITEKFPDVKVIYTRDKDVFIPLADRADIANKQKADLFISLHVNVFQQTNTYGSETFILGNHRSEENLKVAQLENSVILLEEDHTTRYEGFDPNSAESYIMFELIQNEFLEQSRFFADQIETSFVNYANRKSRGVKQAGFLVLRRTTMPGVLVELGFISNKNEVVFLVSNEGKQKMAEAVAGAFANYKNRVDSRSLIALRESETVKPENLNNFEPVKENLTKATEQNNIASIEQNKKKESEKIIRNSTTSSNEVAPITDWVKTGKWYAVQIMASRTPLNKNNPFFSKLNDEVFYFYENGWHKYYTAVSQNRNETLTKLNEIKLKFEGAFLVNFLNGNKE